ncbi:MAG: hypothetical protein NC041_04325 [Bacteroides sp.]|nr:hypothetical protein [Prevotella sp.]MCM1407932.1 hypothetical protein [Treponema brennaborense]MCM1469674.1 hypothetical protein [Bacteroides sp.]
MKYKTFCTDRTANRADYTGRAKRTNKAARSAHGICAAALALVLPAVFSACYEPSPLYGAWSDNQANKITFIADGTFIANIKNAVESPVSYEGNYTVIENILVFSTTDGYSINTEWDIRGSILYLNWTGSDGATKTLNLYHVSK